MGGTSRAHGNTTAVSEFNVYCDPEAAHVVFQAFDSSKLVVVNWEEVLDTSFTWSEFETLAKESSFKNNFLNDLFGAYKRVAASKSHNDDVTFCPADAYTMAVALKPDKVIEESVSPRAFVELHGRCRGLTVYDWSQRMRKGETYPSSENVTVVKTHASAVRFLFTFFFTTFRFFFFLLLFFRESNSDISRGRVGSELISGSTFIVDPAESEVITSKANINSSIRRGNSSSNSESSRGTNFNIISRPCPITLQVTISNSKIGGSITIEALHGRDMEVREPPEGEDISIFFSTHIEED